MLRVFRPIRSRQWSVRTILALPSLVTGALLAGTFVSLTFLPFVAEESDFRVFRRAAGANDVAVTSSYRYAQRYQVYLQLSEHYPGSEFIVAVESGQAHILLHLVAFAAAGPSCPASEATRAFVEAGRADTRLLDPAAPVFRWTGGDSQGTRIDRIQADAHSDRFLVIADSDGLDVVGIDLLASELNQRCADHG